MWGSLETSGRKDRYHNSPMVRTNNLCKHFSDSKRGVVRAVDGVSFTAETGEIFGLLGVNGAGKTTTLRMLSTVIQPTDGTAEVAGLDVTTHGADVRRQIGFMSASTALYGRLTPRDILNYFGSLYGLTGGALKSRIDDCIDKLKIGSFADRLCDKLSTGQKQRVSIARTILHDPPVLFFDEPTSGLDVVTSQTVLEFIEAERATGKTIIFSSHIMSEAERLCDRVAIIHGGVVRGSGTIPDLLSTTCATSFEKAFLSLVREEADVA